MHFHGILVGLIAYLKKEVQKSGTIKIMSIYQLNWKKQTNINSANKYLDSNKSF